MQNPILILNLNQIDLQSKHQVTNKYNQYIFRTIVILDQQTNNNHRTLDTVKTQCYFFGKFRRKDNVRPLFYHKTISFILFFKSLIFYCYGTKVHISIFLFVDLHRIIL